MKRHIAASISLLLLAGCGADVEVAGAGASSTSGTATSCEDDACPPTANGDYCFQPGAGVCGDKCWVLGNPPCTSDANCTVLNENWYCELTPCPGGSNGGICAPRCASDSDCDVGSTCAPNGHCVPTSCGDTGVACPPNFACQGGQCKRRSCSADADCQGFCVAGTCYEQAPYCKPCI